MLILWRKCVTISDSGMHVPVFEAMQACKLKFYCKHPSKPYSFDSKSRSTRTLAVTKPILVLTTDMEHSMVLAGAPSLVLKRAHQASLHIWHIVSDVKHNAYTKKLPA